MVQVFAAHHQNIFGTKLNLLHFDPLFSPCRVLPNVVCSIFPACVRSLLATTLVLHMILAFSCFLLLLPHPIHRCALAAAHHTVRCCFASPCVFFFLKKKKCLETVASWQHCIDYSTTGARLSVPVRSLCRAKGLGRNASPSHKKPYQLRNFNDSNTSQLSHRNHTCTSLPSQPSPYCCSPSLM